MTEQELINVCLELENAQADYPFGDGWAVLRHKDNRKWFACVFDRDGVCINLKCNPFESDMLRQSFKSIMPAYHMNKEHWIMVKTGGDVSSELLRGLIKNSFELTKRKKNTNGKYEC